MTKAFITEELLKYISSAFYISSMADVNLDNSLIEQEVIDSMGLVEIASFIESKFGCPVSQSELNQENFGSINRIADFVLSRSMAVTE